MSVSIIEKCKAPEIVKIFLTGNEVHEVVPIDALSSDDFNLAPGQMGQVEYEDIIQTRFGSNFVHVVVSSSVDDQIGQVADEVCTVTVSRSGGDSEGLNWSSSPWLANY